MRVFCEHTATGFSDALERKWASTPAPHDEAYRCSLRKFYCERTSSSIGSSRQSMSLTNAMIIERKPFADASGDDITPNNVVGPMSQIRSHCERREQSDRKHLARLDGCVYQHHRPCTRLVSGRDKTSRSSLEKWPPSHGNSYPRTSTRLFGYLGSISPVFNHKSRGEVLNFLQDLPIPVAFFARLPPYFSANSICFSRRGEPILRTVTKIPQSTILSPVVVVGFFPPTSPNFNPDARRAR